MKILLLGTYKINNGNEYIQLLADAYMQMDIEVIFEEQNFMFSNFVPDILHIQWPEAIYKWKKLVPENDSGYEMLKKRLQWYKKNDTKIVQTVHNVLPHENIGIFDKKAYDLFLSYADIIVHHGKSSIDIIKKRYPSTLNSKHIIAPHGPYKCLKTPCTKEARAKYSLPIDKHIYTNFGLKRPYKGQDFSYEVFKKWNNNKVCFFDIGKLTPFSEPLKHNSDFCYHQLYKSISAKEVPDVIAATDVFFMGHLSGLNSGLIALALTYAKPLIFPDIGNFKDQVKGWELYETYQVGDVNSAIEALKKMEEKLQTYSKNIFSNKEWIKRSSWDIHVKNIIKSLEK